MRLLQRNQTPRSKKHPGWLSLFGEIAHNALASVLLCLVFVSAGGCAPSRQSHKPSIEFTQIPHAVDVGGPEDLEHINGRVIDGVPGAQVVILARREGTWWVQPFRSNPMTEIGRDGSWNNVTHLGSDYAALLVARDYQPPFRISDLPPLSSGVLAVAITKGSTKKSADMPTIHFSGYDWNVRSGLGDGGGEPCDYQTSNIWVDDDGYLHLLMGQKADQYLCAGLGLARGFGYGTYRFVVSDSTHLPPSALFSMFVRSHREDPDNRAGFSVQLSKWRKTDERNAVFVVQPYYIPGNTARFIAPAGLTTYVFRWEPGRVTFNIFAGNSGKPKAGVMSHTFTSGIPVPSMETIKLDFHDIHHSQNGVHHPVEIVVQKFEYLP